VFFFFGRTSRRSRSAFFRPASGVPVVSQMREQRSPDFGFFLDHLVLDGFLFSRASVRITGSSPSFSITALALSRPRGAPGSGAGE